MNFKTCRWDVMTVQGLMQVDADNAETRQGDLLLYRMDGGVCLNVALFAVGTWASCMPTKEGAPAGNVKMEAPPRQLTDDEILFAATEGVPLNTAPEPAKPDGE